jgi:hypothetical protein
MHFMGGKLTRRTDLSRGQRNVSPSDGARADAAAGNRFFATAAKWKAGGRTFSTETHSPCWSMGKMEITNIIKILTKSKT